MTAVALMTAFASYAQDKPVSWINNVKLSGYGIVQYQSSSKVNDKSFQLEIGTCQPRWPYS